CRQTSVSRALERSARSGATPAAPMSGGALRWPAMSASSRSTSDRVARCSSCSLWVMRQLKVIAASIMQLSVLRQQLLPALDPVGVWHDAVGRADQHALRLVLGADALGAHHRIDDVDRIADRDRLVRAYRFAGVAGRAG